MNCKPGDLAIIIRCSPGMEWSLGRIVQCMALVAREGNGDMGWLIAEPIKHPGLADLYDVVMDSCLRPLRDPGDEAVDEMLRPLPTSAPVVVWYELPA